MLIDLEYFNTFTNDYETSEEIDEIKIDCIIAAQKIVKDYVGYELEETNIKETFYNIYNDFIVLRGYITEVSDLKIDDVNIDINDVVIEKYYITIKNYTNYKNTKIEVDYNIGWTSENVDSIFKIVIAEIATLLYLQTHKNIGITGLIGSDGMSRTFINYTNYNKYLSKLEGYRR
ncbi:MAG: hypothetical protein QXG00_04850 [Candidatus Woesearchaeota archaeon]